LTENNPNKSIGIVLKDLIHPSYNSIISGVKDYAAKKGYSLIITSSNNNHELEKRVITLLSSTEVNGIIIDPILEDLTEIEHLFNLKIKEYPFVLLKDIPGINASVITIDNSNAIRKVVKYLINSGHTKIVHFAGPPSSLFAQERIEGFRHAFSESSLVFNENMIVPIGDDYDDSHKNTLQYFKNKNKMDYPTAIVCFNDTQALAVMIALNKLNINVPEDISIIGNDDISYADIYPVPLTTIRTPYYQIGLTAAKLLIKNIESSGPEKIEHITLGTEFIVRKSSIIINKAKSILTS
jgi:LacI family transcriptional regulator